MKYLFIITILAFLVVGKSYSQKKVSDLVNSKIETEAKTLCKKMGFDYIGNLTSTTAIRDDGSVLVEGTVDYKSANCGNVSARYRGIIKVVIDKNLVDGKVLQFTCFYMNIPTCAEEYPIYYTKEYTVGNDECK